MHSVAFTFFFKNYYSGGRLGKSGYRYKKAFLEKTPVPPLTNKNYALTQRIENVVKAAISRQKSKNTSEEESEINKLVYQLYSLTDEEIGFIKRNQ